MTARVTLYSRKTGRRYTRLPDCAADMLASGLFSLKPVDVAVPDPTSEHTADDPQGTSRESAAAPVAPPSVVPVPPRRKRGRQ